MIASRAKLDARLFDLWCRRDRLTNSQWTELWGLVHSILNSVNLSHFQTLTDSPTDYIRDFFFDNYLIDQIRARNRRQQWLRYENELPDDKAGGDKPVDERNLRPKTRQQPPVTALGDNPVDEHGLRPKTEPLDPLTLLGVQAHDVARSAMEFLQDSEDWVQIFLCCHHCCDSESRVPLIRLAEIHAIETDYCGYWDLLLGPEDEPCDPLAGMVQVWNRVHVYLPSTSIVLGQLSAGRLDAVRALFDELLDPDEQDPSLAQPGVTVTRKTQGGHQVRTGTPLGTEADPRWGYADLFGRILAEKAVKQPARLAAARRGEKAAWIENLVGSLREGFASLGLALSPTDKPERHRLGLPAAGGTLLRTATLPVGDLLDIAVVPSGESDRLRLRISSLSSLPLDVVLETAGELGAPVRLQGGTTAAEFLLRPDAAYRLSVRDTQGRELCGAVTQAEPLERLFEPNLYLLLRILGNGNPVFFLNAVDTPVRRSVVLAAVRDLTASKVIYGERPLIAAAAQQAIEGPSWKVEQPAHVFPVHESTTNQGFVIPLIIAPADRWQVSDAFGTFAMAGARTPLDGLLRLLAQVEEAWSRLYQRTLPARWLKSFDLRIGVPAHIDLFAGESLQVPLLLGVLRALGAGVGAQGEMRLPLGQGPVFVTAKLEADNRFGEVGNLTEKLQGFVRELGSGHPALLTGLQKDRLLSERPDLLEQVVAYEVNSLAELLGLPELHEAISSNLEAYYHPSLNEHLIDAVRAHARRIEFDEADRLTHWLRGQVQSPYYRFHTNCELALFRFHSGAFVAGDRYLRLAQEELREHPGLFGQDDHGRWLSILVNSAIDAHAPEAFRGADLTAADDEALAVLTGPRRMAVYGARCQFHRAFGEHERAIEDGRKAVEIADSTCAREAGRSRNYLVHALIAAYRAGNREPALLAEAEETLRAAMTTWAPADNPRSRDAHLGFCQHYQAELARLRSEPFDVAELPWTGRPWDHPELFTLLSVVRNPQNDARRRETDLERLLEDSQHHVKGYGQASLFGLFDAVYRLFAAVYRHEPQGEPRRTLDAWLEGAAKAGLPGWRERLRPFLGKDLDMDTAEALCDAIPYH
jgi:hypothetical protein